jgi:ribonuclease HI
MANNKHYVVWVGHQPGIYDTWTQCQTQIHQFPQAKYKSFDSKQEAEHAWQAGWEANLPNTRVLESNKSLKNNAKKIDSSTPTDIDLDSISVDVGCSGNPGIVEYKGVDTRTGEVLFQHGPIGKGTNNLGEFLAIVHALALLKSQKSAKTIYSDSVTALSWVRNKRVSTNLVRDESTAEIWQLVDRALNWLSQHQYSNKILKWDTKKYGEIKADYGRK